MKLPRRMADGPVVFRLDGAEMAATLVGAADTAAGVAKTDRVTYREVAAGVDATVTLRGGGAKEALVLGGPESARRFFYHLDVSDGVMPVLTDDRRVEFRDAEGNLAFQYTAPYLQDASGDDVEGCFDKVAVTLDRHRDGWRGLLIIIGLLLAFAGRQALGISLVVAGGLLMALLARVAK